MKLAELFEAGEDQIKMILTGIRNNPGNPKPYAAAMKMVLDGNVSPELDIIIRHAARNENVGIVDEFVNFMGHASDKQFKKYSKLLTDKVRERFKIYGHGHAMLKLQKFERTREDKEKDKLHDIFAFVGGDKFEKQPDGKYERTLDIESLVKIDKYNLTDHQMLNMLRLRANTRDGYHVYTIKLPAGFIKDQVTHHLEPWIVKMIDEHKTRI